MLSANSEVHVSIAMQILMISGTVILFTVDLVTAQNKRSGERFRYSTPNEAYDSSHEHGCMITTAALGNITHIINAHIYVHAYTYIPVK